MAEKTYAWDGILEDLKKLASHNPDFLPNTVLVGGAACWYYRVALSRAQDSDFTVPQYSSEEEAVWLTEAKEVKSADVQFFTTAPALRRRLHLAAPRLSAEHRAIVHWIRHHVPETSPI